MNYFPFDPDPRLSAIALDDKRLTCSYSEAAYFEGNHCAHCAARDENLRLARILNDARRMIDRRSARRGIHA